MFGSFVEFFLKGLACFGMVVLLLWIVRRGSVSYAISLKGGGTATSSIFTIMKLLSRNRFSGPKDMKRPFMISFLSLAGSFFPFTIFPLCENISWQGREIFTEYFRTEAGLAIVLMGIMTNHICVSMVKSSQKCHGQNMCVASRLACFASSMGTLLMIFLSLLILYESFDFHDIVKRQKSFFEYGLFLQPIAAILFFGCIQIEGNIKFFSVSEKNHYNEIGGFEVFSLKLLEKSRWLCLVTAYVFVFLGGYALVPGLEHLVEIFPKFLYVGQFISLIFKISLVAFMSIVIKYSFLEQREIDVTRWAFGKLIPMAFINFVVMVAIKIY